MPHRVQYWDPYYLIFVINDIVNVGDVKKVLFADDAAFYVTAKTLVLCIEKMTTLINELSAGMAQKGGGGGNPPHIAD